MRVIRLGAYVADRKNLVCVGIIAVAVLLVTGPAKADFKFENSSGGSFSLYGLVNPALQSVDDGFSTTTNFVDSSHAQSRLGLWIDQPLQATRVRFNFELGIGAPGSSSFSQMSSPSWKIDRNSIRKVDLSFETDRMGTVFLGQGSMATDGAAESDLSGTSLALYNSIGDSAGSFRFRTMGGGLSAVSISSAMPNLDGGRSARLRYDTPAFSGFRVAVATGQEVIAVGNDDRFHDVALNYQGSVGGTEIAAALGISRRDGSGSVDTTDRIGSIGVRFSSGLNFALAAGDRNGGGGYYYGKLGFAGTWLAAGDTALALDYYKGSDFGIVGSASDAVGVAMVQSLDTANVELYAAYRRYSYDDPVDAYRRISSLFAGARWTF